jgi:hypothetical protein
VRLLERIWGRWIGVFAVSCCLLLLMLGERGDAVIHSFIYGLAGAGQSGSPFASTHASRCRRLLALAPRLVDLSRPSKPGLPSYRLQESISSFNSPYSSLFSPFSLLLPPFPQLTMGSSAFTAYASASPAATSTIIPPPLDGLSLGLPLSSQRHGWPLAAPLSVVCCPPCHSVSAAFAGGAFVSSLRARCGNALLASGL